MPVLAVPPGSLERQLARLERTRRERDAEAVDAALAGLRDAASRPGTTETNLMPHFIRCAEAYATLGEHVRACCAASSASTASPSRSDGLAAGVGLSGAFAPPHRWSPVGRPRDWSGGPGR